MHLLIATTNPNKLREIRAVMTHPSLRLLGLGDLDQAIVEPIEDGETFEANAIKKAGHYAKHSGMWTLADDSGLEVDALDGRPGVRSARYSGVDGSREVVDLANNRKLLGELDGVSIEERTARFVCAMALMKPQATEPEIVLRGKIDGRILTPDEVSDSAHPAKGRGAYGFGYDPLFLTVDGRTTAEMAPEQKNAISHRGQATRAMWERLATRLGIEAGNLPADAEP